MSLHMSLWKKLLILVIAIQLSVSVAPANTAHCTELFNGQAPQNQILEFDYERDSKKIEENLSKFTSEDHRQANEVAEYIINGNEKAEKPKWLKTAGKHSLMTLGYLSYLAGSLYIGEVTIHNLRNAGHLNFFTLHYSNFFESFGFLGFAHYGLSTAGTLSKGLMQKIKTPQVREALSRIKIKLRPPSFEALRSSSSLMWTKGHYHFKNFVFTGLLFTAFNGFVELNRLTGLNGQINDWADFFAGQSGLILYYLVAKRLDQLVFKTPPQAVLSTPPISE